MLLKTKEIIKHKISKMKDIKKLGVWMDHSKAFLMELTNGPILQHQLQSDFNFLHRESSLVKSELLLHNREQHEQSVYYQTIAKTIINFNEVLLFGPTEAKDELFNLIRANTLFDKIKITVQNSDIMTEVQMHIHVREFFA